jgi:glycosyltransferase involved in cell wall biosynthesis
MGGVPATTPMPMAIVMPSFDPGGTERQMIELVHRLDRRRWQVHIACFRRTGSWLARVAELAPIVEFPVRSFRRPSLIVQMRAFARWCRALGVVVVHTTDLPSNMFGLPAAALAGVPARIGNRREINPGRPPLALALQRAAYSCAHRIVTNCRAGADRLAYEGVPARKVSVIPNGVVLDSVCERSRAPRRVIVVANLRPEKGHDVLLRAAAQVVQKFPDARFDIVGGGPLAAALETLTSELGLRRHVAFHGHCEDVASRLAAADLCVVPSWSEAFPNAVLEAMAAGLPVIASAVGGVLEIVRDDETGLLVRPGDVDMLATRICRVMADAVLARSLGAAGRAQVGTAYSFDRMAAEFEAVYSHQLARAGLLPQAHLGLAVS